MKERRKMKVEGKSDRKKKKEIKRLRAWGGPQSPVTQLAIDILY